METNVMKVKDKRPKDGLEGLIVREFEPADETEVRRIFEEGMLETVTDTAFRGLRHHPESLLLYAAAAVVCLLVTMCWWVIVLVAAVVLCGRYFCSRHMMHTYLELAKSTDMADINKFYKSPDSCIWVAVVAGKVVGLVAAVGQQKPERTLRLQRMSVDRRWRRCGVGVELGREVLNFAATHRFASVVLGTTAYTTGTHRLYQKIGFCHVGVTNGYIVPGVQLPFLGRVFYRVRHHHYSLVLIQNQLQSMS